MGDFAIAALQLRAYSECESGTRISEFRLDIPSEMARTEFKSRVFRPEWRNHVE